ncbi:hypothetical protein ACROYT_G033294 [Oculina patagonica]
MGCTVSGVSRKPYEQQFVWNQEKSKTINNSEHFSLCGEGHKKSAFKTGKRSTDLRKIIILRTADSGKNFLAKKIKDSPKIKASSNSSQINTRVALSSEQNKELCGVDRTMKATKRCSCRIPQNKKCTEKQEGRKDAKHISEAKLGCNFQQDIADSRKACFKFYISDCNNNPSSKRLTTPSVSEFYSCMQNGLHVDVVESGRFAVSLHESFFNTFEDECDDDDFMLSK